MLTVVGIIAVLVSVSIPVVNNSLEKAQKATDAANERAAKGAMLMESLLTEGGTGTFYDVAAGKWTDTAPAPYGKCDVHKGRYITRTTNGSDAALVWTNGNADEDVQKLCSETLMAENSGGGGGIELVPLETLDPTCGFTVQVPKGLDPNAVSFKDGVLAIENGATATISSGGNQTSNRIEVTAGAQPTNITLKDVNIATSEGAAFKIADGSTGDVTITLDRTNILNSTKDGCAVLEKNGESVKLTIEGNGSLTAGQENNRGNYGAGIGGGRNQAGSNIYIRSGTITAIGGGNAAGIGGGETGAGSKIYILGGNVTATGGGNANAGDGGGAGIGGGGARGSYGAELAGSSTGAGGNGDTIVINGAEVTATGREGGAGIGGGGGGSTTGGAGVAGNGSNITISNSTVTATDGGYAAKDIGGGGAEEGTPGTSSGTITNSTVNTEKITSSKTIS